MIPNEIHPIIFYSDVTQDIIKNIPICVISWGVAEHTADFVGVGHMSSGHILAIYSM